MVFFDYYGSLRPTSGVEYLYEQQDTSGAAKQAVQEQQFGDEFHPLPDPEIDRLTSRLNELITKQTEMCTKLYGSRSQQMSGSYKGPPYMQREMLQHELNECEQEISSIKRRLHEIMDTARLDAMNPAENPNNGPFVGDTSVATSQYK